MNMSHEELKTLVEALDLACKAKIGDFDQAQARHDVVSQQRAVRAARDVRRMHELFVRISENVAGTMLGAR